MEITSGTAFAPRVGIQLGASTPPAEVARIAALAEELGYGEIWLAEDYFELGGIASVAIALDAPRRSRSGSEWWRQPPATRQSPPWNSPPSRARTRNV